MRHISGKAWREAGIVYGEPADIPALIDRALLAEAARTRGEPSRG